jgi:MFS family permease
MAGTVKKAKKSDKKKAGQQRAVEGLPAAAPVNDNRRWFALGILSMSLMLIVIDSTVVNIAFPSIRATFKSSFSDAEWVNSIYSLIFGAALITWGKLGDQYGRRNIFVAGATLFALSSLGVGLAPNIGVMIGFRALQGLAGAMMSPSTLSIISATFKGRERGIAFGIWGATAGVSAALGPILGGWLIEYGTSMMAESWRLAFLINVPLAAIAITGSFWAIRESNDNRQKHQIDWLGIVFATLGLGSLVYGTIEGQTYGWLYAKNIFTLGSIHYPNLAAGSAIPDGTLSFVPFAFALGLILVALFIWWELNFEKKGGEPLFELGLFQHRSFRYGLITIFIIALGEFGVFLAISIYIQLAKGFGAFETGLQFLGFAIVTMIAAPLAGILSGRFGAKWIVTIGMLCEAASLFWISRLLYIQNPVGSLIPAFMLYGLGVGLAIAQLSNLVLSDIPANKAGQASGATNTLRQLGASLGIAIIGAVLFTGFAAAATPLIQNSTAFDDFGKRVSANTSLSPASMVIGQGLAGFGDQAKTAIIEGLDANEGFDPNKTDPLQSALDNMPAVAVSGLKLQGIDLTDPATIAEIKRELAPDVAILQADLQNALAIGFAKAARAAATLAATFVLFGALSSLMLPNSKSHGQTEAAPVLE